MNTTIDATELAARRAGEVLASVPAALITDIDGTISAIVSRPEEAVVTDDVRRSLEALSSRLAMVAVVTAREEAVARRMVGVDSLTYVGNYALDGSARSGDGPVSFGPLLLAIRPMLDELPCVTIEEKGIGVSFHYRNCEEDDARERLLAALTPLATAAGMHAIEGKQVVELVPAGLPDKGAAIAQLIESHSITGIVYLGDDLSDIPVFEEISRRRLEEDLPGIGIAVVDGETPQAVRDAADLEIAGVEAVTQLLARLVGMLTDGG